MSGGDGGVLTTTRTACCCDPLSLSLSRIVVIASSPLRCSASLAWSREPALPEGNVPGVGWLSPLGARLLPLEV